MKPLFSSDGFLAMSCADESTWIAASAIWEKSVMMMVISPKRVVARYFRRWRHRIYGSLRQVLYWHFRFRVR